MILFDMIHAGTEATMTSLKWMLVYLMKKLDSKVSKLEVTLANTEIIFIRWCFESLTTETENWKSLATENLFQN